MRTYNVTWSMTYDAENVMDAVSQALAALDDMVNRKVGATFLHVEEWPTLPSPRRAIDVERLEAYNPDGTLVGAIYTSREDEFIAEGGSFTHGTYDPDDDSTKTPERGYGKHTEGDRT